ncbi:2-keto-4-pentenoate hydratase [Chromobacterium haemolyticum]|uniref:2-keto-4-pentenoate hydratase n=1 Tax=Chromobacterium fluminis TaxID=3044269 RepID=A0ABX0L9E7_9NEIS|nr:fumarylacetoacetate hydrolase family protein [Chromobacterium haemolyticum]NHR04980.1 2-keto-4-pentenoate hydratase [Chromobacterium haemolyticum]
MSPVSPSALQAAAEQLRRAADAGQPCAPVRGLLGEGDVDAAYQVQTLNVRHAQAQGRRLVGCKIGLTSLAVQRQLSVSQPDFGRLFADMAVCDGEEIDSRRLLQPKIEAEVALLLGRDLDHDKHTLADLFRAVDAVLPALEIVDSRIAGWDIRISDTIADNASSGLFVLGNQPRRLADVDLLGCGMTMELRGEPVSVGVGAACLGNPLLAVLWLADTMGRRGEPLKAGDIVLTGALGPMAPARAGDVFTARIQGLGEVSARFASLQGASS